jgi:hypothetical protein
MTADRAGLADALRATYPVLAAMPADFFGLLADMQRDGLVEEVEYLNESRKKHKRLELTEVGRLRVAQGSGAAAMWRGQGGE